ncbi:MAG: glycosyltransferase family protein [Emcibacter sp.]|nr:glycosyltransferase family protein [Emcibacter sp.]
MTKPIICVTQARMTSSRLPGKILKEVCGRSLLDYHISRLSHSRLIDKLIVATTINETDNAIEQFCNHRNIACVRGSEDDVLSRYHKALKAYPADIVVRVTSDCPLIDPVLLDNIIQYFLDHRDRYDYITVNDNNFPRGLGAEVFSSNALKTANTLGTEPYQREHVTPYIYRKNSEFRCGIYPSEESSGHHRWCVDEPADFDLISKMITAFDGRDDFTWKECLALFEHNPEWFNINNQVKQKTLME